MDEAFVDVYPASLLEVCGESPQDVAERSVLRPLLEPSMAGLVRRKARRQIFPTRACLEDPEDAVEHLSVVLPGPTAPVLAGGRNGKQRFDDLPLLVLEFHALYEREFSRSSKGKTYMITCCHI